MVNDVWFEKIGKTKVKTRTLYYKKTDLNKLEQKKTVKKRRQSKINRLSSSMKGMSISTSQEADEFLEDYDEEDDEIFEPKYNAKKVLTKRTKKEPSRPAKSENEN